MSSCKRRQFNYVRRPSESPSQPEKKPRGTKKSRTFAAAPRQRYPKGEKASPKRGPNKIKKVSPDQVTISRRPIERINRPVPESIKPEYDKYLKAHAERHQPLPNAYGQQVVYEMVKIKMGKSEYDNLTMEGVHDLVLKDPRKFYETAYAEIFRGIMGTVANEKKKFDLTRYKCCLVSILEDFRIKMVDLENANRRD